MNIDKWKKKPTKKELIDIIKNQEEVISELHEVHKHFLKLLDSKDNIIKEVRNQLSYLETYSSKEDVFEDMKRRLDRIDKIIGSEKE